jgi:hypothetical protein
VRTLEGESNSNRDLHLVSLAFSDLLQRLPNLHPKICLACLQRRPAVSVTDWERHHFLEYPRNSQMTSPSTFLNSGRESRRLPERKTTNCRNLSTKHTQPRGRRWPSGLSTVGQQRLDFWYTSCSEAKLDTLLSAIHLLKIGSTIFLLTLILLGKACKHSLTPLTLALQVDHLRSHLRRAGHRSARLPVAPAAGRGLARVVQHGGLHADSR